MSFVSFVVLTVSFFACREDSFGDETQTPLPEVVVTRLDTRHNSTKMMNRGFRGYARIRKKKAPQFLDSRLSTDELNSHSYPRTSAKSAVNYFFLFVSFASFVVSPLLFLLVAAERSCAGFFAPSR